MNVAIVKEWWLASWEMKVIMIAVFISTLTTGDISPYITLLPFEFQGFINDWWETLTLVIVAVLRKFKTSTALVWNKEDADSPEVVKAAKTAVKVPAVPTKEQAEAAKLTLERFGASLNK